MSKKPDSVVFPELDQRARDLLAAVIREHIATAEPVASAQLVRTYHLDVSPATVRNELADLEELGLLTHPHTSAGRVPTDLGYRYFIESLMPMSGLRAEEQVTVSHQFQQALTDTGAWLRVAASSLARLTAEASLVTPPAAKRATLKHLEVVPIHERRVLLVAVLDGGAVRQQVLELGTPTTPEHLHALSARLTDSLASANAAAMQQCVESEKGADAAVVRALIRILEEHDAFPRCQERGLVRPVGHPVQVPLDAADKIAAVVQSRTERRSRDRSIVGQGWSRGFRDLALIIRCALIRLRLCGTHDSELRSSNAHCRKTKECAASKITFSKHLAFSHWC